MMIPKYNQKELFVIKLTELTISDNLKWSVVFPSEIQKYITNGFKVIKCLRATFKDSYVYYVEHKVLEYDPESDSNYEVIEYYFLIIDNTLLLMQISNADVANDVLFGLVRAINSKLEDLVLKSFLE